MIGKDHHSPELHSRDSLDIYLEERGHKRGAQVLYELAESFGVTLSEEERREICIKVAVDRGVEEAVYGAKDYAAVHNAIVRGDAHGDALPQELTTEFRGLLDNLSFSERAKMIQLPATYNRLKVSDENIAHSTRRSVDYLFALRRDVLQDLARKRAAFMAISEQGQSDGHSESETEERLARRRFNGWLKGFYDTYEQLGSLRKIRSLLPEEFLQDGRLGEWRSLERRELIKTFNELRITSEPETMATLTVHGLKRAFSGMILRRK